MKYLSLYIILGVMLIAGVLSFFFYKKSMREEEEVLAKATYTIHKTWEFPQILNEVSGIAWVNDSTLACIQDEEGVIYDFNLITSEITHDVRFGEDADYEAIALKGKQAYVMRSDGLVFEIADYTLDTLDVSPFDTPFDAQNNMESLAYNPKTDLLVTVPKDRGLKKDRYKGLYAISPETKTMGENPLFNIDMKTKTLDSIQKKKAENNFYPSDLAIHPKTGDYYLVDGRNLKLLILTQSGKVKALHNLNRYHFEQPEGIAFSPEGRLFIANEAAGGVATLLEITLEE
ncbi:SdiA-regulated domain-containing protein [Leeuwenhoekiella parthenopeia]|uniref:SdiA-regulated family protein n=1 Tax=Leeuwenhoekiella parthenopeia TaxID=2890320 RepID=A0ABS8GYK9_9FLAO|nr:SdiA-regulated domain-containing protein [Leeuwenhoekiella parthenopeia]MCC4214603.1 hypothetical protein [Leeuwenhoekiella parthenopeia]